MIKRLFLLLSMVFVLLQASYAAASDYCRHEGSEPAASAHATTKVAHWGHHFHDHAGDNGASKSGKQGKFTDADCGFCHAHHLSAVPLTFAAASASMGDTLNPALPVALHGSSPYIPDRPDWQASLPA